MFTRTVTKAARSQTHPTPAEIITKAFIKTEVQKI
jgi:hypothetical protein